MTALSSALFGLVRREGEALLACLADLQDEEELFASANTLAAVEACLRVMARSLADLPPFAQAALAALDWQGWQGVQTALLQPQAPRREAVWYAVTTLVPATLALLEQLRRQRPTLFAFDL